MMPSPMAVNVLDMMPQTFSAGPMMDDFSRQMAWSESTRRLSRGSYGSHGYRTAGNAMRIVKPSSANNSPQNYAGRRRTLMNDSSMAKKRQQALDQALMQHLSPSPHSVQDVRRTSRPVSWHPSSHLQLPQNPMQLEQVSHVEPAQNVYNPALSYSQADCFATYPNFPPTPIAYSGQTSPLSTFSPLSLPFNDATNTQLNQVPCLGVDGWESSTSYPMAHNAYSTDGSPSATEAFPSFTGQGSFNWDSFAVHGFNTCTAPPTPESYPVSQTVEPAVPSEESISYQPLEEPEEEGEILVGMGLYDAPDKADIDPELDNYRTSTSQLFGETCKRAPRMKLEEAWEPPVSDDEDEDGDGDDDDEQPQDKSSPAATPSEA